MLPTSLPASVRTAVVLLLLAAGHGTAHPASEPAVCKHVETALLAGFPQPPTGDRGYDVISYDLDIRLDPAGARVTGTVQIGFLPLTADLDSVQLDLVDELSCDGVLYHGAPLGFSHGGDRLTVATPAGLDPSRTDTLEISYSGRPPRHGRFGAGLMFRSHPNAPPAKADVPAIANVSQTWSAHSWWPCKDDPSDKALVSMAVTVPDTLSAVSNGTLEAVMDPEPGWRQYRWKEGYPIATYLVSVAASNYVTWSEICAPAGYPDVSLNYHAYPMDAANAQYDWSRSCQMMEFMHSIAGPYPFAGEKYDQVEIIWSGAMEHQTASSIAQYMLTGDRKYENIFLHELAHQWYGDSLTPSLWSDIWLNEGFARYFEALWVEATQGRDEYLAFMQTIGKDRHPDLFTTQGILADPAPILPNILVYDKGAWVLHMLRMWIGDDAFFDFLYDYANDPALKLGTVDEAAMIRSAELAAGRDLSGFFRPWLHTAEAPRISWTTSPTYRPGPFELRLIQDQSTVFHLAIPVAIHRGPRVQTIILMLDRPAQEYSWDFAAPVDSVVIDPENLVLMWKSNQPPPPLEVRGPVPNPVAAAGAGFDLFLTTSSQVTVKIYDSRGLKQDYFDLGILPATGSSRDSGAVPLEWNWDPDARLPSGVYWFEFRSDQGRSVEKATLVR